MTYKVQVQLPKANFNYAARMRPFIQYDEGRYPGDHFPQRRQWWGSDILDYLRGHRMKMSGLCPFEVALDLVFSNKISGLTPLA
ncbi:MAG: hypothetical protein JJU34_09210 [Lunatimonas sp.]|nr:hypothetical protein [Lunatimonas sp.]